MGKDGAATLIDFGVARHVSVPDQFPAARYGTPGYQAPELLMTDMRAAERDQGLYQKVDAFAMGCTLFFLCTGRQTSTAPGASGVPTGIRLRLPRTKTKNRPACADARGRSHGRRRRLRRQRRASRDHRVSPVAQTRRLIPANISRRHAGASAPRRRRCRPRSAACCAREPVRRRWRTTGASSTSTGRCSRPWRSPCRAYEPRTSSSRRFPTFSACCGDVSLSLSDDSRRAKRTGRASSRTVEWNCARGSA